MFISSSLQIGNSPKRGRGVFATKKIKANTLIETSPVLVFTVNEVVDAEKTLLFNYFFEWGKNRKKRGLGMGYVSMYNHSYNANCIYETNFENNTISITTIENVEVGEELFINYNAEPKNETPVWFDKNYKKQ